MQITPSWILAAVAAALSGAAVSLYYRAELAHAHAETSAIRAKHALDIKAISDAALAAERQSLADRQTAAKRIESLDSELTKERQTHEADSRTYRAALATGTQRLRVAVANCSASARRVPGATPAASVDNGTAAYADLDPAVAQRVFEVAAADQREIDKLRALQGYVCAVRPEHS